MDNEIEEKRYKNSLDTLSLIEEDAVTLSAEEIAEGEIGFVDILANLPTDRQRFIALALYQGWNQVEIARMLHIHQPYIAQIIKTIRIKLVTHHIRYKYR